MKTTPEQVAALILAIARGEPPPARAARAPRPRPSPQPSPRPRKPRRFFPRAHPGSPDAVEPPITSFGTAAAAEVLADVRAELARPPGELDRVIAAAASVAGERAQAAADFEVRKAEQLEKGRWVGQCKARDAENGLQCGRLEGHLVATSSRPATKHRTARGEFVRCLPAGAKPGRLAELEEWANDRRDVGDVSP